MVEFSKNNEKKINQVFQELLRAYGISRKYDEHLLKNEWENVVGQTISQQTQSLDIDKDILYVRLNAAALREELGYSKSKLKEALNKSVGKEIIRDIVFL